MSRPARISGRVVGADPGPAPRLAPRTREQRAMLAVGGVLVLAGLFTSAALAAGRVVFTGTLLVHLVPLAYLTLGALAVLYGLAALSETQRARSDARGGVLALGLLVVLLCGPLSASFICRVDARSVTYTCYQCGWRVRLDGERNTWGAWLSRRTTLLGAAGLPTPPRAAPAACDHLASLPPVR